MGNPQTANAMSAPMLTILEVANLTQYSRSAIHYMKDQGHIDSVRQPDGSYLVPATELPKVLAREKYARRQPVTA